jgi:RNAse (barnase) inhibitor barstar
VKSGDTQPSRFPGRSTLKRFIIDGEKFSDLDGFYDHVGDILCPGISWGRNLNALNDILRGGFGVFEYGEPVEIHWHISDKSMRDLGWDATIKQLRSVLAKCEPSSRPTFQSLITDAENNHGQTVFDWIVDVFMSHDHIDFDMPRRTT